MSMLTVKHHVETDIPVVRLAGKITIGEGSVILRNVVREYLSKGTKKLVIELGGVSYVDSSGILAIVNAFLAANKMGIIVVYADISRQLRDILKITKLIDVLLVYPSVNEAVQDIKDMSYADFRDKLNRNQE